MSLVFEQVSYSYDAAHEALHDVDFEAPSGAFLGLIGHTGSGKSTIAQLMNALLVPSTGRVLVEGMDTSDKSLHVALRRAVGLVFQYPEQQLFAATVAEDVAFGPHNLGCSEAEIEQRSRRALARVDMNYDEFATRSPFEMSGGQRRRVALAGTLAMEPQILVLDEPAAGMDPATNRAIKALLRSFHEEGKTIVLISHSMEDIAELCDRVIVMDQGTIFANGTPEEVFAPGNAAELRRINLGVPRATKFALELAAQGFPLEGPDLTEEQLVAHIAASLDGRC